MAGDLLSAMVQRSKQIADPRAAAYASGNRAYQVRLSRPGVLGSFDRVTGLWTNPPDTVLYEGPARIYAAHGGIELEIGDERTPFNAAQVTIDYFDPDNSPDPTKAPQTDDVLEVLDTPLSQATHLAGRSFEVTAVDVGGHYGTGWTMQVLGAGAHRGS